MLKSKRLIFIHIPKTAGSTFLYILRKRFTKRGFLYIGTSDGISKLADMSEKKKLKIKCLAGHIRYGVHEFVPSKWDYITFLRHPIARVTSMYYYILRTPDHYFHKRLVSERISFEDFVSTPHMLHETANQQTYLLSGFIKPTDSSHVLEKAKENLKQFLLTGITERFDESLLILRSAAVWDNIYYLSNLVAKNYRKEEVLSPETRRNILSRNDLDLELYNYANELLDARIMEYGENFKKDLSSFKSRNKLYQDIMKPLQYVGLVNIKKK